MTQTHSFRGHLAPERLALALEGLEPWEREHIDSCVVCRVDRYRIWSVSSESSTGSLGHLEREHEPARPLRDLELSIGEHVGPYTVEALLGRGGMARVYRIWHRELQAPMALKVLQRTSEELWARLLLEGSLQARLRHPHIASVFDVQVVHGCPALVLEYIEGADLAKRLRQSPKLKLRQIETIASGLLLGVEAAHASDIIHRDLKPQNVLLAGDDDGIVAKVSDFGLARVLREAEPATIGWTGSCRVMGTPAYMAPEQFRSARDVDRRADVFSLGAILYEMLTGRPAFGGDHFEEIRARVLAGRYLPVRELAPDAPERMVRAIDAALMPDPEARPSGCEQLRALWEGRESAVIYGTTTRKRAVVAIELPFLRRDDPSRNTLSDEAWATHERSVRELSRRYGGRALARGENPLMRVFSTTSEALSFVDGYRLVARTLADSLAVQWVPRVAVATGLVTLRGASADQLGRPVEATGDAVETAPRLLAIAEPGRMLVAGEPPIDRAVSSHGFYRLVGLGEPVELFGAGSAPAPPDTASAWRVRQEAEGWKPIREVRARLPESAERLAGREDALAEIESTFAGGEQAVALFGAPGVGKTALALHFAKTRLGWWPGGAVYCALTAVSSAEVAAYLLLEALAIPLGDGDPVLVAGLALQWSAPLLLLLDGADALDAHARSVIAAWMAHAPRVRFLLTARTPPEPLPARCIGLGPHPLPSGPVDSVTDALDAPAIRQFVEQVACTRLDWTLHPRDLASITKLVRLLHGLPRAIELAAGSTRSDDVQYLCQQLGAVLSRAEASDPASTLDIVLQWCWAALTDDQRAVLVQCSVFEGPFSSDAAEHVVELPRDATRRVRTEIDLLAARRFVARRGEGDFVLPEDIRRYAARWGALGCADVLLEAKMRHATYGSGINKVPITDRLAAVRHAITESNTFLAVSTCLAAGVVLRGGHRPAELAARVLEMQGLTATARAELLVLRSRHRAIVAGLERSRYDMNSVQSVFGEARVHIRARLERERRAARECLAELQEASEHFEAARNRLATAGVILVMGDVHRALHNTREARASYHRALELYRGCGSRSELLQIARRLAALLASDHKIEQAHTELEHALAAAQSSGETAVTAAILADLGAFGRDKAGAREHLRESVRLFKQIGDVHGEANAWLALDRADAALAAFCAIGSGDGAVRALRALRRDTEQASDSAILAYERAIDELRHGTRPARSPLSGRAAPHARSTNARSTIDPVPPRPLRSEEAATLLERGRRHRGRGHNEEALACFSAALGLAQQSGERAHEGVALREMGAIHRARGHFDAALGYFAASLSPGRGGGCEASMRRMLSLLEQQQARFPTEVDRLVPALCAHQASGDRPSEGSTLAELGRLYQEHGLLDAAATYHEAALAILYTLRERSAEAKTLASLAQLRRHQGEDERAVSLFESALAGHREVGDLRGEAATLLSLARLHGEEGRSTLAIGLYLSGITRSRQAGENAMEALAHARLGDLLRQQGRLTDAEARLQLAATMLEGRAPLEEATWQGLFGALCAAKGEMQAARHAFDRAAGALYTHPCPSRLAEVLVLRAEAEYGHDTADARVAIDEISHLHPAPGVPLMRRISAIRDRIGAYTAQRPS